VWIEPKVSRESADLKCVAALVEEICDPERFKLNQAIKLARTGAVAAPGLEIEIVRYLESYCMSRSVAIGKVLRGLEVLEGVVGDDRVGEGRLIALLRPFLRSSDPGIASKCVLILGRRSKSMAWLRRILDENDYRIRANLVEALWGRDEPEVKQLLLQALEDTHQRVVANATYGLFLMNAPEWLEGLETLLNSRHPAFRRSGIWLLKMAAPADALDRIGRLIRDPDPRVKRAAFEALGKLPKREARRAVIEVPAVELPALEDPVVEAPADEVITEVPAEEPAAPETPEEEAPPEFYPVPNLALIGH